MNAAPVNSNIFQAIADPTRRTLLDLLSEGARAVKAMQEPFDISQPALSQHLRVLRRAGLVSSRRIGREQWYRLNAEPLTEVSAWIAPYERFWRGRMKALGDHLDRKP